MINTTMLNMSLGDWKPSHKLQGKQCCPRPELRTYKVFLTQNR